MKHVFWLTACVLSMLTWGAKADVRVWWLDDKLAEIHVDGDITKADADRYLQIDKTLPHQSFIVQLNSRGGDVLAALRIGEAIRNRWAGTLVDDIPTARCLSACVLIFAAGADRFATDDQLGIHRPYYDPALFAGLSQPQAKAKYDQLTAVVSAYLSKMTLSDRAFGEMMKVPSNNIRMLGQADASAMGLIGKDPGYEEWVTARIGKPTQLSPEMVEWIGRRRNFQDQCWASATGAKDDSMWIDCGFKFDKANPRPRLSK